MELVKLHDNEVMEKNKKPVQHFDIDLFDDFPVERATLTPEERIEIAKAIADHKAEQAQHSEIADKVKD